MALYQSVRGSRIIAPVPSMAALLGIPFISKYGPHSQPAGNRLFLPPFLPCFILATCAPFWLRLSALSISQSLGTSCCWLLKYYPSISSVSSQNPDGYLSLHPLVSALDNPETPPHTALDCWELFRIVAESQIHFGHHFSWDLYGTQSISVVFIVTLVSSLLLAMAMQKL
ncbi:MAG: hypothetical protein ACLT38_10780 [Akkermansia sp.]